MHKLLVMIERLKLKLTIKLLLSFLLLTIMSVTVLIVATHIISSNTLQQKTFEQLTAISSFKKSQIESYYKDRYNNISVLSSTKEVRELYDILFDYADSLNIKDSDPFNVKEDIYLMLYNKYVNYFQKFINSYEFEDMYLISEQGHVMFSVKRKKDFGTNLAYGKYKTSVLGNIWKETKKTGQILIKDFEPYEPNENKPTQFLACPFVYNENETGTIILQLPEKGIDRIINEKNHLGITSITYLVGLNRERQTELRNNSNLGFNGLAYSDRLVDIALKKGDSDEAIIESQNGVKELVSYMPLNIKGISWAIFTKIHHSEIIKPAHVILNNNLVVSLFILVFISFIGINLANKIIKPIISIKDNIIDLSLGILPKKKTAVQSKSEIGDIQDAFNRLVDTMKDYVVFANKIGKKQLDAQFEPKSKKDALGTALVEMQRSLIDAEKTTETRKKEEEKQRWTTEGIARFGDILRQHYETIEAQADNIVVNLVNFLGANQGGLFTYNNTDPNDPHLEMISCFAYERKKFLTKRMSIGEGLIGACFVEKETIHLKNVPEDYPNITSGLGGAIPKEVLIVPLKMDIKILGVIELVSFNQFKDYQIAFVEKIAENIASTIASAQINEQTARLLKESKINSEQMAAQEEEMRQNMEELQATQEESQRKEIETLSILDALNKDFIVVQLNLKGFIISANTNFIKTFNQDEDDIINASYSPFCPKISNSSFIEKITEEDLKIEEINDIEIDGKTIWVQQSFSAVYNNAGEAIKIIVIARDISDKVYAERKIEELKREINELKGKM